MQERFNQVGSDSPEISSLTLFTKDGLAVVPISIIGPFVGLSRKRVYQLVSNGTVRGIKPGQEWFGCFDDVRTYMSTPRKKGGRPKK